MFKINKDWRMRLSILESLSKRRFCQHGRQREIKRIVIDGK